MDTNDKNVNVHIIHSMKGGCGKTACSLLMALKYASETKSNSNASVLLLDADFRVSALQWLLFENPSGTKPESYHHLLDTFQGKISNSAGKRKGTEMHHRFALPENFLPSKNLNQYIMGNCITMEDILFKSFSYEKLTTKLPEDSVFFVMDELTPEKKKKRKA